MPRLIWDAVGERVYETGVSKGVLYLPGPDGSYGEGVAWNGLTAVNESPTGGEPTPQYADNIKYLNLVSAEEFGCTIEAFTYPDEFILCDGSATPTDGVSIGQQSRSSFGFSYQTIIGNDLDDRAGYKIHLVYGCMAAPSEKSRTTVNDTPEAMTFSWAVTTTPVDVPNYRPTASLTIDSTKVDEADLQTFEDMLYGAESSGSTLPLPAAVIAHFTT